MEKTRNYIGDILIIIAGLFWGSMGIFVRHLNDLGFTSIQVACLRLTTAGLIFAIILLIKDRKGFKINVRDIPLFLALGLVSILFFTCCYFTAIRLMTMSTAAILLYTSPIWVMILAIIFLKEKFSVQKLIALILAFAGCVLRIRRQSYCHRHSRRSGFGPGLRSLQYLRNICFEEILTLHSNLLYIPDRRFGFYICCQPC